MGKVTSMQHLSQIGCAYLTAKCTLFELNVCLVCLQRGEIALLRAHLIVPKHPVVAARGKKKNEIPVLVYACAWGKGGEEKKKKEREMCSKSNQNC